MIRIAGSTFAFGDMSLEDSCDILVDLGFDLADVGASGWSSFNAYVPQQVVQNPDDADGEADRIKRIMDDKGIGVSELFICDFGQAINHPAPGSASAAATCLASSPPSAARPASRAS